MGRYTPDSTVYPNVQMHTVKEEVFGLGKQTTLPMLMVCYIFVLNCIKLCLYEPFITGSAQVQRVLECLHISCSARFRDKSVLAQLGLGNRVQPHANQGQV